MFSEIADAQRHSLTEDYVICTKKENKFNQNAQYTQPFVQKKCRLCIFLPKRKIDASIRIQSSIEQQKREDEENVSN